MCPLVRAHTAVATPSGERAIGTLKVGDQVTAYDPSTGKTSPQTVQHVWINHDSDLIDLTLQHDAPQAAQQPIKNRRLLEGEPLGRAPPASTTHHSVDETAHTTAKHPFLTIERGWVPAGQLTTGMHVVREDGSTATVADEHVVPGAANMWNLTVSQVHTYAVGVGQYVVHNCNSFEQLTTRLSKDQPVAVIGRAMSRVRGVADQLRDAGYNVKTWEPRGTPNLEANRSWLRYWAKIKGAQVVDIGEPQINRLSPSPYYDMERRSIYQHWGYQNVIRYNRGD